MKTYKLSTGSSTHYFAPEWDKDACSHVSNAVLKSLYTYKYQRFVTSCSKPANTSSNLSEVDRREDAIRPDPTSRM
jgi:hypothetical protein